MWYEDNPSIINAELIEDHDANLVFDLKYLQPITSSKRKFKRDFIIEKKRSFDIAGIDYHYYRNSLYAFGEKHYNGLSLDLEYEPWNEYDPNAIVIRMLGCKLGYISRYDTEEVSDIMTLSKRYSATLDCSCMGWERINISFLQEFHDTYSLPYQTDVILKTKCSNSNYKKHTEFIKGNIGHIVTFWESYENNLIAICTDMHSVIGYIDDAFIAKQSKKTPIAGFIEDVINTDETKTIEVRLRLLMKKSVINKNYLKSYRALSNHFGQFCDAGTYRISLSDLVKIVPRRSSRNISAYEPLVKYLKDYHAIQLIIENEFNGVSEEKCFEGQAPETSDNLKIRQNVSSAEKQSNNSNSISRTSDNTIIGPTSAIALFFPLDGVTIGKTTWKQAEEKGYKVEIWEKGPSRVMSVGVIYFWDHEGEGVFTSAYITNSYYYLPPKWKSLGFSWNLSYDEWISVFEKMGFAIIVTQEPSQKEYSRRKVLFAQFKALSSDGNVLFWMYFDFGECGYLTTSPKTLYSITVDYVK